MKSFQTLLPMMGLVIAAQAHYFNTTSSSVPAVYTILTTNILTTVCPAATTFAQGTKTYTATAGQTLTITDCPCTYSGPHPALPSSTQAPHVSYSYVGPPIYTTIIVSEYTTYCPSATTVVQGSQTYTVSSASTLTITNCPCTLSTTVLPTITVSYLTTYLPEPTTLTIASVTYPVASSGSVTIPVVSTYTPPAFTSYSTSPSSAVSTAAVLSTAVVEIAVSTAAGLTSGVVPSPVSTAADLSSAAVATTVSAAPPSPTRTGQLQVSGNAAVKIADTGMGTFAAAGLAMLLM